MGGENFNGSVAIDLYNSRRFDPINGRNPNAKQNRVTPLAQMSTGWPKNDSVKQVSGETKAGVPVDLRSR